MSIYSDLLGSLFQQGIQTYGPRWEEYLRDSAIQQEELAHRCPSSLIPLYPEGSTVSNGCPIEPEPEILENKDPFEMLSNHDFHKLLEEFNEMARR